MPENKRGPLRGPAKMPSPPSSEQAQSSKGKRHVARSAGTKYGVGALESALQNMAEATERSHGLFRNSAAMGNLIAGGQLEERFVVGELLRAADARGMNRRLAERTIERGIDRGKRTPRTPPPPRPYTNRHRGGQPLSGLRGVARNHLIGHSTVKSVRIPF